MRDLIWSKDDLILYKLLFFCQLHCRGELWVWIESRAMLKPPLIKLPFVLVTPLNDSPIDETFSCWWVLLFITLSRCWRILLLLFYVPHKMTETYNIKDLPAFVNQFWMKVFSKSCTNLSKLKRMRQLSLIRMKCFLVRDKFHQICDVLLRLIIERGDRGGQAELILWSFGDIAWDLWSPPTPRLLTWTISTTRCVPTGRVSLPYQKNQNM